MRLRFYTGRPRRVNDAQEMKTSIRSHFCGFVCMCQAGPALARSADLLALWTIRAVGTRTMYCQVMLVAVAFMTRSKYPRIRTRVSKASMTEYGESASESAAYLRE